MPNNYSEALVNMRESGGFIHYGRGGLSAQYENVNERYSGDGYTSRSYSTLTGCDDSLLSYAAARGIPGCDTRSIPDSRIVETCSFPIPEPATHERIQFRSTDPKWHATSLSTCDFRMYSVLAWTLGATLLNQAAPTEEEQDKARAWFAARDARRAAFQAERQEAGRVEIPEGVSGAGEDHALDDLIASTLDLSDPDGFVQLYPPKY